MQNLLQGHLNVPDLLWELYILKKEINAGQPHQLTECLLDRDLSYGEILAGWPGAWLVEKIFFICM